MMNRRKSVLLILILLSTVAVATTAKSQSGFIIERADASVQISTTGSSALNGLLGGVGPRFVVQRANAMKYLALGPDSQLLSLLGQVGTRFVIQRANANRFISFSYPAEMIHDTVGPQLGSTTTVPAGGDSVNIIVTTDEYATLTIQYGSQSGVYTQTIVINLYKKTHEATISGLVVGNTYYYRLSGTDRSGNSYQSGEYSFKVEDARKVFLPLLIRR